MEAHRMFQNILLAEYYGTFHDTHKIFFLLVVNLQNKFGCIRDDINDLFAHKLVPLTSALMCISPFGKTPIFPHMIVYLLTGPMLYNLFVVIYEFL